MWSNNPILGVAGDLEIARRISEGAVILFLLCSIAKCLSLLDKPGRNFKSTLALILVMISLFLGASLVLMAEFTQPLAHRILCLAADFLVLVSVLPGLIFAILAVVELSGAKRDQFKYGLKPALISLIASIVICNIAVDAAIQMLSGSDGDLRQLAQADSTLPSGPPLYNPQPLFLAKSIDLVKENIAFTPPPPPWVKMDPKTISPSACLAFVRANPEMYFIVSSEELGAETPMTTEQAADLVVAHIQATANNVRWLQRFPQNLSEIPGIGLHNEVAGPAGQFTFVHWIGMVHGRAYHLAAWGAVANEATVRQEASMLFAHFHELDPNNIAHSPNSVAEYRSPRYHYTLKLGNAGWSKWSGVNSVVPSAEFGALNGSDTAIYTSALVLGSAPVDFDILLHSTAKMLGADLKDVQRIRAGSHEAAFARFTVDDHGVEYSHLEEIARVDDTLYIAHGWTSNLQKRQLVLDAIANIVFELGSRPDPAAMSSPESRLCSLILNDLGLTFLDQQHQPDTAVKFFQQAQSLAPDDVIIAKNVAEAHLRNGQPRAAKLAIDAAIQRFPSNSSLRIRAAYVAEELGDTSGATTLFVGVFKTGYQDDDAMREYVKLMIQQGEIDPAVTTIEQYRQRSNSRPVAVLHAMLLGKKGDHASAIKVLEGLRKEVDFDPSITFMLGDQYAFEHRYSEAMDLANELFKRGVNTADAYLLQAEAESGLQQYRQAKTSLETALSKSPNDRECQDLMRYVLSMLGEGDSTLAAKSIEPVSVPPALFADIPTAAPADAESAGAYYIARITAVSFDPGKDHRTTEFRRMKPVTRRGVESMSTLEFPFDPVFETIFVNSVEVRDQTGKVVATGKAQDCFVTDSPHEDGATLKKVLHVPIPGLVPDYTLDLVVTRSDLAPPAHMEFVKHFFSGQFPVQRAAYVLKATDMKQIGEEKSPEVTRVAIDDAVCWKIDAPQMLTFESMAANPSDYLPHLLLGDSESTWKNLGSDYLASLRYLLTIDPDCKALAAELIKGHDDEASRIAAIVGYVQREFAYKAIEFGRRGRIPNKPSQIIQNKYGDCKDHALLLYQLLCAAGYDARLVLANTDDSIEQRIASMDQFNHMVVCLRDSNGAVTRFFDCTNKESKIDSPPFSVAASKVLVLDSQTSQLMQVPDLNQDACSIQVTRQMSIESSGDLKVHEILRMTGGAAAFWRDYMGNLSDSDRIQSVQRAISSVGLDAFVDRVEVQQLRDPQQPLVLDLAYTARARFGQVQNHLIGTIPACWERYWFMPQEGGKRVSPFKLRMPIVFQSDSSLALPTGMQLANVPTGSKLETKYGTIDSEFKAANGTLSCRDAIRTSTGQFDAGTFPDFLEVRRKFVTSLEPTLMLQSH